MLGMTAIRVPFERVQMFSHFELTVFIEVYFQYCTFFTTGKVEEGQQPPKKTISPNPIVCLNCSVFPNVRNSVKDASGSAGRRRSRTRCTGTCTGACEGAW